MPLNRWPEARREIADPRTRIARPQCPAVSPLIPDGYSIVLRCIPADDPRFAERVSKVWDRLAGRDLGSPDRWMRMAQGDLRRDYPHVRLKLQDELAVFGRRALYAYRDGDSDVASSDGP
jgi:hypothetical protein